MKKRSGPLKRKVSRTNRNDAETAVIQLPPELILLILHFICTPILHNTHAHNIESWIACRLVCSEWNALCLECSKSLKCLLDQKREEIIFFQDGKFSLTSRPTELSTLFAISGPEGLSSSSIFVLESSEDEKQAHIALYRTEKGGKEVVWRVETEASLDPKLELVWWQEHGVLCYGCSKQIRFYDDQSGELVGSWQSYKDTRSKVCNNSTLVLAHGFLLLWQKGTSLLPPPKQLV